MKGKLSLSTMLHNRRFAVIFSLVAAVAVWVLVSFGPANIQTRVVSVPLTVDLTNTYAGANDLRVLGENSFTVNVRVEGTRSVITQLTADDIAVRASLGDIQGAGESTVSLSAVKTGRNTDFTVLSLSPASVVVQCDYWSSAAFIVTGDVSEVTVADEKTQQIGDVQLGLSGLKNGQLTVHGPLSVIRRIATVTAKPKEKAVIAETTRMPARLIALDAENHEVDLSDCSFDGMDGVETTVTVPVWVQKTVDLTYKLAHVPAGLNADKLVSLSHKSITLVGEQDTLDSIAATVSDLGTFDFDRLTPDQAESTVNLPIPSGVRVLEGNMVTVSLNIGGNTTKTVSCSIRANDDVTVANLPAGKTLTWQAQKFPEIVLCGKAATLRRIKADDLRITVDASGLSATGSVRCAARVTLPNYPDVWVYYGTEETPYPLYGTLA